MNEKNNWVVVAKPTPSNAYLLENIQKSFPQITVLCMKNKHHTQRYLRKCKRFGFFPSVSIKLLAMLFILERLLEKMVGHSIWHAHGVEHPVWRYDESMIMVDDESDCLPYLKNAKGVLLLNGFRFKSKFFRKCKQPILQVMEGKAGQYMGQMGMFWAYAKDDQENIGRSIILRNEHFLKYMEVGFANFAICQSESLRSLQVKSTLALADLIPTTMHKINSRDFNYTATICEYPTVHPPPGLFSYLFCVLIRKKLIDRGKNIFKRIS